MVAVVELVAAAAVGPDGWGAAKLQGLVVTACARVVAIGSRTLPVSRVTSGSARRAGR
ncbi:MAG: hypothetical protein GX601_05420 [Anaerolineales bacterium]|nr:hypothetical protein [Anaerolineales bacterium]